MKGCKNDRFVSLRSIIFESGLNNRYRIKKSVICGKEFTHVTHVLRRNSIVCCILVCQKSTQMSRYKLSRSTSSHCLSLSASIKFMHWTHRLLAFFQSYIKREKRFSKFFKRIAPNSFWWYHWKVPTRLFENVSMITHMQMSESFLAWTRALCSTWDRTTV